MADERGRGATPPGDANQEVAERRRHTRYLDEVRIRYRDLERALPSCWGRSRDLSLGGLCLVSEQPLSVGSYLALEIQIPGETAPVLALSQVVRSVREERTCASGLEFLWVSEEDRANLRRLAAHFARAYGDTQGLDPR